MDMKEEVLRLNLGGGFWCRINVEDFPRLQGHAWRRFKPKFGRTSYAYRCYPYPVVRMHRFLLNAKPHEQVDHKDGNGLNNVRSNLRICTMAENMRNRGPIRLGYSPAKGVCCVHGNYRVGIKVDGNRKYFGTYKSLSKAISVYNEHAKVLHGEFFRPSYRKRGWVNKWRTERNKL